MSDIWTEGGTNQTAYDGEKMSQSDHSINKPIDDSSGSGVEVEGEQGDEFEQDGEDKEEIESTRSSSLAKAILYVDFFFTVDLLSPATLRMFHSRFLGFSLVVNRNAPMGAGMLSFPFTFYCTGLMTGIAVSLLVIVLTFITLNILIDLAFLKGGFRSYQGMIEHYLGPFWKKVCEAVLLFYATGICIVYFVVLGQFISPVVEALTHSADRPDFYNNHKVITLVFSCLVIFPLVLLRKIQKLWFTSFIAIGCAIALSIFMIVHGFMAVISGKMGPGQKDLFWLQYHSYPHSYYPLLFLAIPLKCFGYQSHVLLFPISYEVKKGNRTRINIMMVVSITLVSVIYMSNGLSGWFAFGTDVKDNILNNFSGTDIAANVIRLACGINILFSFPVQNFAARLALKSLIFGSKAKTKELPTLIHVTLSFLYFLFNLIIALFVPMLSVIFGFIGAIGAVTLMFFFPALLSWKVNSKRFPKFKWFYRTLAIFLFAVSFFFSVTGVIAAGFSFAKAIENKEYKN